MNDVRESTVDMTEKDVLQIAKKNQKNAFLPPVPPDGKFVFTQHFPGYIDFEPMVVPFNNIKEILDIEDIKWWSEQPNFYGYFVQVTQKKYQASFFAMFDYDEEYYGCKRWYCLGFIDGGHGRNPVLIQIADSVMGRHKMSCQISKWKLVYEPGFFSRPEHIQNRMMKEAGMNTDISVSKCDCGFDGKKK